MPCTRELQQVEIVPISPSPDSQVEPEVPRLNRLQEQFQGFVESPQGKAFIDLVENNVDLWMDRMTGENRDDRDFCAGGVEFGRELLVAINHAHNYGKYVTWSSKQEYQKQFTGQRQNPTRTQQRQTSAQSI